jgi:hypothetical protein
MVIEVSSGIPIAACVYGNLQDATAREQFIRSTCNLSTMRLLCLKRAWMSRLWA